MEIAVTILAGIVIAVLSGAVTKVFSSNKILSTLQNLNGDMQEIRIELTKLVRHDDKIERLEQGLRDVRDSNKELWSEIDKLKEEIWK